MKIGPIARSQVGLPPLVSEWEALAAEETEQYIVDLHHREQDLTPTLESILREAEDAVLRSSAWTGEIWFAVATPPLPPSELF